MQGWRWWCPLYTARQPRCRIQEEEEALTDMTHNTHRPDMADDDLGGGGIGVHAQHATHST